MTLALQLVWFVVARAALIFGALGLLSLTGCAADVNGDRFFIVTGSALVAIFILAAVVNVVRSDAADDDVPRPYEKPTVTYLGNIHDDPDLARRLGLPK